MLVILTAATKVKNKQIINKIVKIFTGKLNSLFNTKEFSVQKFDKSIIFKESGVKKFIKNNILSEINIVAVIIDNKNTKNKKIFFENLNISLDAKEVT